MEQLRATAVFALRPSFGCVVSCSRLHFEMVVTVGLGEGGAKRAVKSRKGFRVGFEVGAAGVPPMGAADFLPFSLAFARERGVPLGRCRQQARRPTTTGWLLELNGRKTYAHFAGGVSTELGVAEPELAVAIGSPALDEPVVQARARVVRADGEMQSHATGPEVHGRKVGSHLARSISAMLGVTEAQ
jgi:hypothetical protein